MTPTPLHLLLTLLLGAGCVSTRFSSEPPVTLTADQRLTEAYRDMASADLEHLMQLYTPDALILSAAQPPVAGVAAIRAMWRATFERYEVRLTPTIDEVTDLGALVVVRGRAVGALSPRVAGPSVAVETWFLQLYRRQSDGSLRFWRGSNGPVARTP